MFIKRQKKHDVPGLNTTSTADISFMLLIFFLVTSSMYTDRGLNRLLPTWNKENKATEPTSVDRDMLMTIRIDSTGQLFVDSAPTAPSRIQGMVKPFILRGAQKHLIALDVSPQASYDVYFQVQNVITSAYRECRSSIALARFHKELKLCNDRERELIRTQCPWHVTENAQ